MKILMGLFVSILFSNFCIAATSKKDPHPCTADALRNANALMRLYNQLGESEIDFIDDKAEVLKPVESSNKKRTYDVLQVWGHIYKADYRMRFIFSSVGQECVLMGEEILDFSKF